MKLNLKKIILAVISLLGIIVIDRFTLMPQRAKKVWVNESGRNLGDPIAYKQDFIFNGSEIIFNNNKSQEEYPFVYKNRQSKFYLAGCYFATLYIYDTNRGEMIVYSDY